MATIKKIEHKTQGYQKAMLEIKSAFLVMQVGGSINF